MVNPPHHAMAAGTGKTSTTITITTTSSGTNAAAAPSSNSDSGDKLYKGVRKRKWGKWVSEIRLPNSRERIWLGSYDSPEKAARAFDAALYCLRGRHANFNFPHTPFNLDINVAAAGRQSLTPQEIQAVAAKFANNEEEEPPSLPRDDDDDDRNQDSSQSQPSAAAGANSSFDELFGSKSTKSESTCTNTNTTTTTTTTASSSSMYEFDGTVQVDHGDMRTMDWTFLNMLDNSNEVASGSDCGLYSELDKMHSGELLYSTLPPPPFEYNADEIEIEGDDDAFSHQSFLWNWNF